MDPTQALQELDLVVARVVAVAPHPGGRAPSALLSLDFGTRGSREAPLPLPLDEAEALVGRQVVCSAAGDSALVLSVHLPEGIVPLAPAAAVADGSPVA